MFATMLILGMFAALAMAASPQLRDGLLKLTRALPASTSAVTSTTAIDTGVSSIGGQLSGGIDVLITAPALTTTQLPDSKVMVYDVVQSDNSDLSSPTTLYSAVITQTGAGGAGAALATKRVKLPSDSKRFIGLKITPSASGTGDASGVSGTLELIF